MHKHSQPRCARVIRSTPVILGDCDAVLHGCSVRELPGRTARRTLPQACTHHARKQQGRCRSQCMHAYGTGAEGPAWARRLPLAGTVGARRQAP